MEYREDDITPDHIRTSPGNGVTIQVEIPVSISTDSRRSLASDAHDIAGYKGRIEYITMTPLEDGSVQFTMMIDMNDAEEKEMYFYTPSLAGIDQDELFCLNGWQYNMGLSNKRLMAFTIPAEYAGAALAEQVTIRLYSLSGAKPTYDLYTYTME